MSFTAVPLSSSSSVLPPFKMGDLLYGRYCNNRVAVYDLEGQYLREMKGDWNVVHSLQLYEDEVAKTTFEIHLRV
jgi:hypothetical protein